MLKWWHLGPRNNRMDAGPALATLVSVTLGVTVVVCLTSFYESTVEAVRREVVSRWLGTSHLSIVPPGAHWGTLDARLAVELRQWPEVAEVSPRLVRVVLSWADTEEMRKHPDWMPILDAVGMEAATGWNFLPLPDVKGELFSPDQSGVVVMESQSAVEFGLGLGDTLYLKPYAEAGGTPFRIVGLFDSRRLADFQRPAIYLPLADLQALKQQPDECTVIDITLADASEASLAAAQSKLESWLATKDVNAKVSSAAARLKQLADAEVITRIIVTLTALVTLVAAFFIVVTTMSASLYKQARLLGVMRCIGFTRGQLAVLVMAQVTPLTVAGALLGIPVGWGAIQFATWWASDLNLRISFSLWGLGLALGCVALTWALSVGFLMLQVCGVSPLRATQPESAPVRRGPLAASFIVGLALIAFHLWLIERGWTPENLGYTAWLACIMLTPAAGFVLCTPLIVWLFGGALATLLAPLFGLRGALGRDSFSKAPWLGSAVCWVLMGGQSLIIFTAIRGESVVSLWDFPSKLPEAFVWTPEPASADVLDKVRALPGVKELTGTTDVECRIEPLRKEQEPAPIGEEATGLRRLFASITDKLTRPVFVAGDLNTFPAMMKLGFQEGSEQEALQLIRQGGHVLIPPQTARKHNLHLGDTLRVTIGARSADFTIAGIIESPALDLVVTFFGAESYMEFAAASALLGTREDLERYFGLRQVSMIMFNMSLPDTPSTLPAFLSQANPPNLKDPKAVARLALESLPGLALDEAADAGPPPAASPSSSSQPPGPISTAARSLRGPYRADPLGSIEPDLRSFVEGRSRFLAPSAYETLQRFEMALNYIQRRWNKMDSAERWRRFRERLLLLKVAATLERPDAVMGSIRRLRESLEHDVQQALTVATWAPTLALIIGALGIGNLMMVRVAMRARPIAMMRAVGMTRSQVLRLVLLEAATLGALGAAAGVGLGFFLVRSDNILARLIAGVRVPWVIPWPTIAAAVGLTVFICLIAGLKPARRAARDNVVAALQVE